MTQKPGTNLPPRILVLSSKGLALISYPKRAGARLRVRCVKEGHYTWVWPQGADANKMCRQCSPRRHRVTVEFVKAVIRKRGGVLVTPYTGYNSSIKIKCAEGHIFPTIFRRVQGHRWCPNCQDRLTERICRRIFEVILKEKFPSVRPNWLRNYSGYPLELDGFSKKLKVAFEYQGRHHYKTGIFRNTKTLLRQKKYDRLKRRLCGRYGVRLISIPHNIKLEKLQSYILLRLRKIGIHLKAPKAPIDLSPAYSRTKLKELQVICGKRGGRLQSRRYLTENDRVEVKCGKGHVWTVVAAQLRRGKWCRECFRNATYKWKDWKSVEKALRGIIRKYGSLPSQPELIRRGYSGLVSSIIQLHGGINRARQRMRQPLFKRSAGYWTRENLIKELLPLIRKHGSVPKKEELAAMDRNDLIGAIRKSGGFKNLVKNIRRFGQRAKGLAIAGQRRRNELKTTI